MVLFKGNPPGGAEGRPFIYFENHKNYVASFIVVLYDLYRSLATPLPSEMFSRVMQDCHSHADIVRVLAENKAFAIRRS